MARGPMSGSVPPAALASAAGLDGAPRAPGRSPRERGRRCEGSRLANGGGPRGPRGFATRGTSPVAEMSARTRIGGWIGSAARGLWLAQRRGRRGLAIKE